MNDNEVNRVIADYMGCTLEVGVNGIRYIEDAYTAELDLYTSSLDALVPVWRKINQTATLYYRPIHCDRQFHTGVLYGDGKLSSEDSKESIQQAAAHATAMAILGLDK